MIRKPSYDFTAAQKTFVDCWPAQWLSQAPNQTLVSLNAIEMNALGWQIVGFSRWFSEAPGSILIPVVERLDKAIEKLGRYCFIRLTSRSPKDSSYASRKGMKVHNGAQALALIMEGSERCASDLRMALEHNSILSIVVREWIDFFDEFEFRCCMKNRVWVAGSQASNRANRYFSNLLKENVVAALSDCMKKIIACTLFDNGVFDIVCRFDESAGRINCILLDANPLFSVTDLGLYKHEEDFDCRVRFCAINGEEFEYSSLPIRY